MVKSSFETSMTQQPIILHSPNEKSGVDSRPPRLHYPQGSFSDRPGPQSYRMTAWEDGVKPSIEINEAPGIARPRFRVRIPCCEKSYQASFCPYTLPQISDLGEETFGRP